VPLHQNLDENDLIITKRKEKKRRKKKKNMEKRGLMNMVGFVVSFFKIFI